MITGVKCPNRKCPSNTGKADRHIWAKGFTPTLQGEKRRYVCFICGKTFYLPGAKPVKPRHLRKRR